MASIINVTREDQEVVTPVNYYKNSPSPAQAHNSHDPATMVNWQTKSQSRSWLGEKVKCIEYDATLCFMKLSIDQVMKDMIITTEELTDQGLKHLVLAL